MKYATQGFSAQESETIRHLRRKSDAIQILLLTKHIEYSNEIQDVKLLLSSLNGSWQDQFDHIWNRSFSTNPSCAVLYSLISNIIESNPSSVLANKSLAEIEDILREPQLTPSKLATIFAFIQIASNPVGYHKQIKKLADFNVKQLFIKSPFYLPILVRALGRNLYDNCNYRGFYHLRHAVWQQEVQYPPSTAVDPFAFYAFGHQVLFLNFFRLINSHSLNITYRVEIDPRSVANRPLLNDQIIAGFPITPINVLSSGPSPYRGWGLHTVSPLKEHIEAYPNISDYEIALFNYRTILKPRELLKSKPFSLAPRLAKGNYVKQFMNSVDNFYVANWRTNLFKGETTDFNHHRNSNENEVVSALLKFAEQAQYHVAVICMPSQDNCARINASPWLHLLNYSGDYSYNDYLSLLAKSTGFMTGDSGAWMAGSVLYNKKTLLFDCPWLLNPELFFDSNTIMVYKDIIIDPSYGLPHLCYDDINTAAILPHDGIRLKEIGIEFSPLCHNKLLQAFLIFHKSLHMSRCESDSHMQKSKTFFSEIDRISRGSELKISFASAYRAECSLNSPK